MQVFRRMASAASRPCALTMGNFDGLHLGHRAMLEKLCAEAHQRSLTPTVMTFEPHPRELFTPESAPARLTSLREKVALMAACGIERVHVCKFDRALAALPAQIFIERILVGAHRAHYIIVGDDFRFGQGRAGDFALLSAAGQKYGFDCTVMPTVNLAGVRVSSSAVRHALAAGELAHATQLLGRPYVLAGHVVHGEKIGTRLGYPTANIPLPHRQLPLSGVFATTVEGIVPHALPAAASLGVRPTVGEGLRPILEVHLLDWQQDVYGAHVTVNFLHKLRDEYKFASMEALRRQISQDVDDVRHYFRQHPLRTL